MNKIVIKNNVYDLLDSLFCQSIITFRFFVKYRTDLAKRVKTCQPTKTVK